MSGSPHIPLSRREFLVVSAAVAAGTVVASGASESAASLPSIIDVNVNLSRWPLRRLKLDDTSALVEKLRRQGATEAWAGSFDGLLQKDLTGVNDRLAEECHRFGGGALRPFGSINPKAPGWEEELRRCADEHRMKGIRLHPNYHGYKLDDPQFVSLFALATERGLIIQIALVMEDERMMHPLFRVEPVDTAPLADLVKRTPGARVVLLDAFRTLRAEPLTRLLASGDVCIEISMLEGVGGIERLLEQAPASRVLFGSHAPLFYFESAMLKLRESSLTPERLNAICRGNAIRILAEGTAKS